MTIYVRKEHIFDHPGLVEANADRISPWEAGGRDLGLYICYVKDSIMNPAARVQLLDTGCLTELSGRCVVVESQ